MIFVSKVLHVVLIIMNIYDWLTVSALGKESPSLHLRQSSAQYSSYKLLNSTLNSTVKQMADFIFNKRL